MIPSGKNLGNGLSHRSTNTRCALKAFLLRVGAHKRYGDTLSAIFADRYPTMTWFVCNKRNALAPVKYNYGALRAVIW